MNISSYLTTTDNAPRLSDEMDWERYSTLHNHILELGWVSSGRNLDQLDRRSWWEFHGENAEALRGHLSPSLVKFLEHAQHGCDVNSHSFFYYVNGLMPPGGLWLNQGNEIGAKILTLYSANDIASHADGLKYDQEAHDCIMQMSIMDSMITLNGRTTWHCLETVLTAWINMITAGKIVPVSSEIHNDVVVAKYPPWILVPYSQTILSETLQIFADLVDMIEERMPHVSGDQTTTGLVSEDILNAASIPEGFAREFLMKARKPRFRYIAPGLQVPSSSNIANQSFVPVLSSTGATELMPILLFPAEDDITLDSKDQSPFRWPYNIIQRYSAGIYLSLCDRSSKNAFEDECRLILPFDIGSYGFARNSDGDFIGQDRNSSSVYIKGVSAELYQPGYRPFTEHYNVRLASVFESWMNMINAGDWEVDENGVKGGIEVFRDADSEEHWWKYQVPITDF